MSSRQARVVASLGIAQTLAWASSYYLPAVLANPMAAELGLATPWIFVAFSCGLLVSGFLGPLSGRLIDLHGGHPRQARHGVEHPWRAARPRR